MARTQFEVKHGLRRAYQRKLLSQEQVQRLKPFIDERPPRLNTNLNFIGNVPRKDNNEPRTTDYGPWTCL
ncbi:MAG: hypothetical protein ACE1ZA_12670 [Pseudomonadales bacterium]